MRKFIVGMFFLGLLEISLALYLTFWRHDFWNAVEARQLVTFCHGLIVFTLVALALCFVASYAQYLGTLAAIKWREKLNAKGLSVIHDSKIQNIENISQRIQEDCAAYPNLVVIIGYGVVKSIVYCAVFSITLSVQFTWVYLGLVVGYSVVATFIAKIIAKPLIKLQYQQQQVEATYRNNLKPLNFKNCINIVYTIAKRTKYLQYFQLFYGQVGIIIPICIIAPSYFASTITFGALMQGQSIMGTILENMSYGINTFSDINKLLSCRKRLKEIGVI